MIKYEKTPTNSCFSCTGNPKTDFVVVHADGSTTDLVVMNEARGDHACGVTNNRYQGMYLVVAGGTDVDLTGDRMTSVEWKR